MEKSLFVSDFKYESIWKEGSLSVVKLYAIYQLLSAYGFMIGLLIKASFVYAYRKALEYILNATKLTPTDILFLGNKSTEIMTGCVVITFKNFSEEKIRERLEESISKINQSSSRLIYFLGNYFWKHVPVNRKRLDEMIRLIKNIEDYEGIINLINDEINKPLNLNITGLEFLLVPYEKTKNEEGCLIVKFDHSMTDGLHLMTFVYSLTDNFKRNQLLSSSNFLRKNDFKSKIKAYFYFILFGWFYILKFSFTSSEKKVWKQEHTGKAVVSKPCEILLSEFKKIAKDYNLTVNDLFVNLTSISLKKLFPSNDDIVIFVPVGYGSIPHKEEDIVLQNIACGIPIKIDLVTDFINQCKDTTKELKNLISNKYIADSGRYVFVILAEILPLKLIKVIGNKGTNNVVMCVSNVAGSSEEFVFNGCNADKILPFISLGPNKSFSASVSYKDKITINAIFDISQNINPKKFNDSFIEAFNKLSC